MAVMPILMRAATVLTLSLTLAGCDSPVGPDDPDDDDPPGGALLLTEPIVNLNLVERFIPFGAELPGSGGTKNPAYEFVVTGAQSDVVAAAAGRVTRIDPNAQGDVELHVEVTGTDYLVIYDHVTNVAVVVGQNVTPGQRLGDVGVWTISHGRVELQINRDNDAVCPRDIATTSFNTAHDAALANADPALQSPAWTSVCLATTVQP
jgi:hypothetical protein